MKRIFIAGNKEKTGCLEAAGVLRRLLSGKAEVAGVDLEKEIRLPRGRIDLVICLGGDGAFLNLVPQVIRRDLPIMGINFGHMGFLTSGLAGDMEVLIKGYLRGETEEISRMMLELRIPGAGGGVVALNDVVVGTPDLSRVFTLRVSVCRDMLFQLSGDGLIISTPTGSTAHSLSAGGTLLDPRLDAIQLTPIAPQSLSSRPVVVHPSDRIRVRLVGGGPGARVIADGRAVGKMKSGDCITVTRSRKRCRMVQVRGYDFFQRLREKLGWRLHFEAKTENRNER